MVEPDLGDAKTLVVFQTNLDSDSRCRRTRVRVPPALASGLEQFRFRGHPSPTLVLSLSKDELNRNTAVRPSTTRCARAQDERLVDAISPDGMRGKSEHNDTRF